MDAERVSPANPAWLENQRCEEAPKIFPTPPGRQQREDRPDRLRIIHLCQNDQIGGGPLASYRLHRALLHHGADSRMLVMRHHQDDGTVEATLPPWLEGREEAPARIADRLPLRAYPGRSRDVVWSPGWFSASRAASRRAVAEADIIGLYWINGGFLSIREIDQLLRLGKPVVWRLSDLWPFTGGCHHAGACSGYRAACGRCPQLGSSSSHDLSARLLSAKKSWPTDRLTVVCPSRWLARLARDSALFAQCRIEQITTGIDVKTFFPRPRAEARRTLGLPPDRRLILFGANNGTRNPKKGFALLIEALEQLAAAGAADDIDLVVFGQTERPDYSLSMPLHMMGTIYSESTKALLFSTADVFATPSLEENLPNTVIEAMACGTPTVAFDVGGTGELIGHRVNGYLATPGNSSDFSRGLAYLLDHQARSGKLGEAARSFIARHHDNHQIAGRYLDLYADLLGATPRQRVA